jgi:outer membrane protein OmpA-like peptidoglycan-associated protein
LRNYRRITPFAQVLAGGAYATAVTLDTCSIAPCVPLPEQGSFAMTAGGGLDINLSRRISFRAIQAEYLMTRFANTTTSVRSIQNDMRLSSGLVFRFGGHAASPLPVPVNHAPVAICSANPTTVHVNWEHPVMLQAQAVDTDGDRLSYMWSVSAGTLANPSSPSTEWHIDDLSPGAYKATLHVDDGHGGVADCSVNLNVEVPPAHPSLTCSAGSSTVYAGDTVTLNVQATNVDPKTLVWSPTSGQIDTSSAQARLITSKGVIGKYTMTAHAQSPSGEEASCQVVVDTQLPIAIVEVEKRLALHSIYFPTAKPTVEHLERGLLQSQRDTLASLAADFLAYREYVPNAKLVLEGHADPRGSDEYNEHLSERRVDASKRFLVGKGVSETSIEVKALGDRHDLTDAEVRDAVDHNDELTPAERATLHKNMKTIILASNRRVDITLTPTGQHSTRTFPFNAKDAIILISQREPHTRKAVK